MRLSVVIPALDEAEGIRAALEPLQAWRSAGHEVLLADGGSRDATVERARPLCDRVIEAPRGRARQMNAGAALAAGEGIVFLHADTRLPPEGWRLVEQALDAAPWGRFDVAIDSARPMLRVVSAMMNWRSRRTGIATGDQAIFVRAEAFRALGGFADIALMEDIEVSARARARAPPAGLSARASTSARRWERHGVWRTILLMWRLRAAYALGADPACLSERYARHA